MRKKFKLKSISISNKDVRVDVKFYRFAKQFHDAQFILDTDVMTSMIPLMPSNDGNFKKLTKLQSDSLAGSGLVVAAAKPQGRFLYYGKKMVDSVTGKGPRKIPNGPNDFVWRYKKGAELIATNENLNLTRGNPSAVPRWFETAKQRDLDKWVNNVKETAGGGKK